MVVMICCLFIYGVKEELEASSDDYERLSSPTDNRFSYNICSVPTHHRQRAFVDDLQLKVGKLPLAHAVIPPAAKNIKHMQKCFYPKNGYQSWNNGLVTNLLPGRTPKMCKKLFMGEDLSNEEEEWIAESARIWRTRKSDDLLLSQSRNCTWIQQQFTNLFYVSSKELDFPIAYVININTNPHQILRFLKVIYRPHNLYCLHFDSKSESKFKHIIFNIASCVDNVIVPRKIESVYRGWYTIIEAHASCFSDLVLAREKYPWKYVFTLCGMELPLRTNAEVVQLLKPLKGMSSVKLVGPDGRDERKYRFKNSLNKLTGWVNLRDEQMPPPPYNMKIYKSWAYVALSYDFVEYFLCSEVGLTLRDYLKDAFIPEENVYPMLFMKPGVPGGYRSEFRDKLFYVMSCTWLRRAPQINYNPSYYEAWRNKKKYCYGERVHDICIIASRDLSRLAYKPGIAGHWFTGGGAEGEYTGPDRGPVFHNKYFMDDDPVVIDCMEQELIRRNKLEFKQEC